MNEDGCRQFGNGTLCCCSDKNFCNSLTWKDANDEKIKKGQKLKDASGIKKGPLECFKTGNEVACRANQSCYISQKWGEFSQGCDHSNCTNKNEWKRYKDRTILRCCSENKCNNVSKIFTVDPNGFVYSDKSEKSDQKKAGITECVFQNSSQNGFCKTLVGCYVHHMFYSGEVRKGCVDFLKKQSDKMFMCKDRTGCYWQRWKPANKVVCCCKDKDLCNENENITDVKPLRVTV